MSQIQILQSKMFGSVQVINENNKSLFCGSDVAKALGYAKPHNAIKNHCNSITLKQGNDDLGRPQQMIFIPEGDVYRLIVKSKLPEAEKFEHWLFDEALPTIHKTGGYVNNEELFLNTYLPNADDKTKLLFSTNLQVIRNLNQQLEDQKPLVRFAETVQGNDENILVREVSKLASNHIGVDIGEKGLYQKLREWGLILKTKNEPTRRAYKQGLLEYITRTIWKGNSAHIVHTVKVTPKGQKYIINRLIDEYNGEVA